jgi:hypothetical protein
MAIIDIEVLKEKFGPGDSPRSADYIDLIETLADDRNAVYYANTAPEDTEINQVWFDTSINRLFVYFDNNWVDVGNEIRPKGPQPTFVSGKYYTTNIAVTTGTAQTLNRMNSLPFWVHATTTFDRIGIRVTATSAGSTIRLGIYSANASNEPDALVLDAGTVDSATATGNQEITIDQELTPGLYFLITTAQGGTPSIQVAGNNFLGIPGYSSIPFNSIPTNQGIITNFFKSDVSGALPNPFGTVNQTTGGPRVFLRAK